MVYFLVAALFLLTLFVIYAIRTVGTRTPLFEQWANQQQSQQSQQPPPIDLATNKTFKAFLQFHGTVCDMWNEVVQKSMDSDQTTLSKADYIQQMEQAIQPPMTLIQCASTLSATTDPAALLQEIPTDIDPYKNTLTFLVTKTTGMLSKLEGALQGNIEQFATYEATVTCDPTKQTCQGTNISCSVSSDPSGNNNNNNNNNNSQLLYQQILARITPILGEIPDIQPLYSQAQANITKLKEYSGKAQNGTLVNDVNIPPST